MRFFCQIIFIFALLFAAQIASAQAVIEEIMYDVPGADTGREWVEVRNIGTTSFDLTTWKLFEGDTNHGIKEYKGRTVLSSGTIAIIADNGEKFLTDHPNYPGVIFESSFSLSNEGETFGLKDNTLALVHQIAYAKDAGANGDGDSFQKIDSEWHAGTPTPGEQNTLAAMQQPVAHSNPLQLEITITGQTQVGAEISFVATVTDANGNAIESGTVAWNFGDGSTAAGKVGVPTAHTYRFAGTYGVTATYTDGSMITQSVVITDAPPGFIEEVTISEEKSETIQQQTTTVAVVQDDKPMLQTSASASAAAAVAGVSIGWWLAALAGLVSVAIVASVALSKRKTAELIVDTDYEIVD